MSYMNNAEHDVGRLMTVNTAPVIQCPPLQAAKLGMGAQTGVDMCPNAIAGMCVASLLRSEAAHLWLAKALVRGAQGPALTRRNMNQAKSKAEPMFTLVPPRKLHTTPAALRLSPP